ncbi:hypothetical protein oki423_03620 [Helicobacter pylori]
MSGIILTSWACIFPTNKYSPFDKYDGEILKFLHHTGQKKHKLFSFELKVNLKLTNLKESYFQSGEQF